MGLAGVRERGFLLSRKVQSDSGIHAWLYALRWIDRAWWVGESESQNARKVAIEWIDPILGSEEARHFLRLASRC